MVGERLVDGRVLCLDNSCETSYLGSLLPVSVPD